MQSKAGFLVSNWAVPSDQADDPKEKVGMTQGKGISNFVVNLQDFDTGCLDVYCTDSRVAGPFQQ
jgi:hypothetical protein